MVSTQPVKSCAFMQYSAICGATSARRSCWAPRTPDRRCSREAIRTSPQSYRSPTFWSPWGEKDVKWLACQKPLWWPEGEDWLPNELLRFLKSIILLRENLEASDNTSLTLGETLISLKGSRDGEALKLDWLRLSTKRIKALLAVIFNSSRLPLAPMKDGVVAINPNRERLPPLAAKRLE